MTDGQYPFRLKNQKRDELHEAIEARFEAFKSKLELDKKEKAHYKDLEKIADIATELEKYIELDLENATKDELCEILDKISEIVVKDN